jgi:hypothetical protein
MNLFLALSPVLGLNPFLARCLHTLLCGPHAASWAATLGWKLINNSGTNRLAYIGRERRATLLGDDVGVADLLLNPATTQLLQGVITNVTIARVPVLSLLVAHVEADTSRH